MSSDADSVKWIWCLKYQFYNDADLTNCSPTSASGVVLLTIQPANQGNQRRAAGIYVQPDGEISTKCTRGAGYSLSDGQLYADGLSVSASPNTTYTPFVGSATLKGIDTTFAIVGGQLAWNNATFSGGTAGFYVSNGIVIAAFTDAPPSGSIPVVVSSVSVSTCPGWSGKGAVGPEFSTSSSSPATFPPIVATSTSTSPSGSATPTGICPAYDGKVKKVGNTTYGIQDKCDTSYGGQSLSTYSTTSLDDCLEECDNYKGANGTCIGASYFPGASNNCLLKANITDIAYKRGYEAGHAINATSTSSPAYPTPTGALCPNEDRQIRNVLGFNYEIECSTDFVGTLMSGMSFNASDFPRCIEMCNIYNTAVDGGCAGATFNTSIVGAVNCHLYQIVTDNFYSAYVDGARLINSAYPSITDTKKTPPPPIIPTGGAYSSSSSSSLSSSPSYTGWNSTIPATGTGGTGIAITSLSGTAASGTAFLGTAPLGTAASATATSETASESDTSGTASARIGPRPHL
ncbi:MAG: hypothetical protein Q9160_000310 [Pyrenula sp. 1 TL-2023]